MRGLMGLSQQLPLTGTTVIKVNNLIDRETLEGAKLILFIIYRPQFKEMEK